MRVVYHCPLPPPPRVVQAGVQAATTKAKTLQEEVDTLRTDLQKSLARECFVKRVKDQLHVKILQHYAALRQCAPRPRPCASPGLVRGPSHAGRERLVRKSGGGGGRCRNFSPWGISKRDLCCMQS